VLLAWRCTAEVSHPSSSGDSIGARTYQHAYYGNGSGPADMSVLVTLMLQVVLAGASSLTVVLIALFRLNSAGRLAQDRATMGHVFIAQLNA